MKAFLISGTYADPRQIQAAVKEKALSTIGSKHKLKRWQINITDVKEISGDEITNHVVKYQVGE